MTNEQKNVPELRFPEFDGEWEEKKLGSIACFSKGKLGSKKDISQNGIPFILYGELYTKYNAIIEKVYSKIAIDKNNLKVASKNEVLIPSSGETSIDIATASCIDINEEVAIGGDINILTPKNVDGRFISLSLNGVNKVELSKYAQGKTVVHLYNNDIKKLKLSLPINFEEQQKIGDFFSKLDRQIELEEKKLELLEQQKKGYMQKIFSQELRFKDEKGNEYPEWKDETLSNLGKTYTGLSGKSKEDFGSGNGEFITYMNVFKNNIANTDIVEKVNISATEKQNKVEYGDILYMHFYILELLSLHFVFHLPI